MNQVGTVHEKSEGIAMGMGSCACPHMRALVGTTGSVFSQPEQVVEVTIKDFKFVTKQRMLRLGFPSVIKVRNENAERHDFGSTMFDGIPARFERDGMIVHGRGVGGMFLDPKRDAVIRFNMSRPGRHEFRCSIHPNMTGELLLLSTVAV